MKSSLSTPGNLKATCGQRLLLQGLQPKVFVIDKLLCQMVARRKQRPASFDEAITEHIRHCLMKKSSAQ